MTERDDGGVGRPSSAAIHDPVVSGRWALLQRTPPFRDEERWPDLEGYGHVVALFCQVPM